ncbi:hypothetical protein E4N04_19540 [Salmonella enterica]|nr:hypothetical protein [Salmonella enterica]
MKLSGSDPAADIIALLTLCQQLQSEQDGAERPAPDEYSRKGDVFSDRIRQACLQAARLRGLLAMSDTLASLGAEFERLGLINVSVGEDYAEKALTYLSSRYLAAETAEQTK